MKMNLSTPKFSNHYNWILTLELTLNEKYKLAEFICHNLNDMISYNTQYDVSYLVNNNNVHELFKLISNLDIILDMENRNKTIKLIVNHKKINILYSDSEAEFISNMIDTI